MYEKSIFASSSNVQGPNALNQPSVFIAYVEAKLESGNENLEGKIGQNLRPSAPGRERDVQVSCRFDLGHSESMFLFTSKVSPPTHNQNSHAEFVNCVKFP